MQIKLFSLVLWHINHCRLFIAKSIFIHINSSISNNLIQYKYSFCLHTVKCKTVLFQIIQFSISTQFSSIWCIHRILSGATTPSQSGPGSDGNKEILCILQNSSMTGASPSDCLVSYVGHLLGESYPSAEMQSVYSLAPADWVIELLVLDSNTWNHLTVCKQ